MDNTKKEFNKIISHKDVYTDSSAEYILPDYNGDVRKILLTKAEVHPSGKFAEGDEMEFSGIVVYNVVYTDSENKISSVNFTSDYEYAVKCSHEKLKDAYSDTRVANYQIRLIGPRKISAKATLSSSVSVVESEEILVVGSAFEKNSLPEMATAVVKCRNLLSSASVEREYAESVEHLDGAIADEVRIVYCSADVSVDNIEVGNDHLTLFGKLKMMAIISNAEAPAYPVEKTVPIEAEIPFEGISNDMRFIPEITVTSVKGTVNADDTGSDIVMSVIVEFSALAERNDTMELISDAYNTTCVTENTYTDFDYEELCDVVLIRDNFSAEIARDGIDAENIREIVLSDVTAKIESSEIGDEGVLINGEFRFCAITSDINDDGSVLYSSLKISAPYSKNVKINLQNAGNLRANTKVLPKNVSVTLDANNLYVSASVDVFVEVISGKIRRVLSSCDEREELPFEKRGPRVTVYYPSSNETLFSVAKKFHVTSMKLAEDNSLTESVSKTSDASEYKLSSIKRLIIT